MPAKDAQKLLYSLPAELKRPPESAFAGPPLQGLDALYRKYRPSALYEASTKAPAAQQPWAAQFAKRQPVLLVIVPGIFGEFIAHPPYEEFFANQQSAFARHHLPLGFNANHRLEIPHHFRVGMRASHRADAVECVFNIGHPITQRFIQSIF